MPLRDNALWAGISAHRELERFPEVKYKKNQSGWWFQIFFIFHPYLGKIPILTNIFQWGWNHQLAMEFSIDMNFWGELWAEKKNTKSVVFLRAFLMIS